MTKRSVIVALLVFGTGCGRVSRVRECRKLAKVVNPRLDQVQELVKRGSAADYRAAAAVYTSLAKDVRGAAYTSADGAALCKEYATMLDSVAPAVSAYAAALTSEDTRRIEDSKRAITRLERLGHGLVGRMDAYCTAP